MSGLQWYSLGGQFTGLFQCSLTIVFQQTESVYGVPRTDMKTPSKCTVLVQGPLKI